MGFIYIFSFVLAFCALVDELLIARAVSLWAVNNGIWYALAAGIFIGGMGIGAWLSGRWRQGLLPWQRVFIIECWLSVLGGCAIILIYAAALGALFLGLLGNGILAKALFFIAAFIMALAVGIGAGMELPLLMAMADEAAGQRSHKKTGRVLLMDYTGALVAGICFPLIIFPWLNVISAAILVAFLNAGAALALAWRYNSFSGRIKAWALLIGLAALLSVSPRIEGYFTSKYYFSFQDALSPTQFFKPRAYPGRVERLRSPYQLIDFVTTGDIGAKARSLASALIKPADSDNKDLEATVLFLNHDFQFAVSFERIYHEAFAHIPVAMLDAPPRKVLILGGGDGLLLREILKYPEVKDVVLVDIDPGILSLFRSNKALAGLNDYAFHDPRVTTVVGDAYQYVRRTKSVFNMIFCDFPNPDDYDLSKLYSREFYTFARSRLLPDGLLVLDAPGLEVQAEDADQSIGRILDNTLKSAGYKAVKPFFSRLEDDNAAALKVLDGDADAYRGYRDNLCAGFMMAAATGREFIPGPLDVPGLRVMNNERVRLGLEQADGLAGIDSGETTVNSIVRPLFPLKSEWSKLRTAY